MNYGDYNEPPKKQVSYWYVPSFSGLVFWLLIIGGFTFLIWIVASQNSTTHNVHSVMSKVETMRDSPKGENLVGVSSIMSNSNSGGGGGGGDDESSSNGGLPQKIRLCAKEVYYTRYGEWNDTLVILNNTIDEILTPPLVNSYFHPTSVTLEIEFNTNVAESNEAYMTKSLLELNPTMKFMLFTYNITTNYPFFSTIILRELEFDSFEQTIRPPRDITMCSNSNDMTTRRCDHRGDEKIITIHNKNLRPLTTLRTQRKSAPGPGGGGGGKPYDTTTPQTKQPVTNNINVNIGNNNNAITDEEMYDMIGGVDPSYSHADAQKAEISGLRIYNVVFYKRNQDKRFISHNPNSRNNNNNNMIEESVITLKLKHC